VRTSRDGHVLVVPPLILCCFKDLSPHKTVWSCYQWHQFCCQVLTWLVQHVDVTGSRKL
jgi:hypothetical protein